jgi:hypothetical protein
MKYKGALKTGPLFFTFLCGCGKFCSLLSVKESREIFIHKRKVSCSFFWGGGGGGGGGVGGVWGEGGSLLRHL